MPKINKVNFDGAYLRSSSGHFYAQFVAFQLERLVSANTLYVQDFQRISRGPPKEGATDVLSMNEPPVVTFASTALFIDLRTSN